VEQQGHEVERRERQDTHHRARAHDRQPAAQVTRALADKLVDQHPRAQEQVDEQDE